MCVPYGYFNTASVLPFYCFKQKNPNLKTKLGTFISSYEIGMLAKSTPNKKKLKSI